MSTHRRYIPIAYAFRAAAPGGCRDDGRVSECRAERRGGRAPEAPSWPIRAVPGPDGDAPWRVVRSITFFIFLFAKIASWSNLNREPNRHLHAKAMLHAHSIFHGSHF